MFCHECNFAICTFHNVPFHFGETCVQYDARRRDEELASMALVADISTPCPGPDCGWSIEKTGGCDHMTCKSNNVGNADVVS